MIISRHGCPGPQFFQVRVPGRGVFIPTGNYLGGQKKLEIETVYSILYTMHVYCFFVY